MSIRPDDISALIEEVHFILREEHSSHTDVISRLLLRASNAALHVRRSSGSRESLDHACYATLIALADEHINNVDFHVVASRWLELYVDANLLSALSDIAVGNLHPSDAGLISRARSVRKLDMAIIVGGATRTRRMEWIQRAIKLAQVKPDVVESRNDKRPSSDVPRKRARLDSEPELLYAPNAVLSLPIPPSLDGYVSRYCQAPFVLRGYLASEDGPTPPWPALTHWKDAEYLLSRIGRGRWVPVEEGRAYDDRDWGQRIVPFEDFLERAGFHDDSRKTAMPTDRPMYLAQHSLFRQFPDLERDMTLPDYVWSRPPVPSDFPSYREPDTRDGVIVNVWVGSGSGEIISPAHTDPYYNCYAQVVGRKRVWLAPPKCAPYMACHVKGSSDPSGEEEPTLASEYMNNTSTIPVLRPDITRDDLTKSNPLFMKHVWPHCMEAVLEPGDLMVMPPGWWHAMRGEGPGPGWSVSMWY